MTSTHWEKVGTGRYASELHGHVLQAIRKDGPYLPEDRPYLAIVDRVPIGEAWNLKIAKTKAIQWVERQNGKAKAERAFRNGAPKPALGSAQEADRYPPMIPDPEPVQVQPEPEPAVGEPGPVQTQNGPVRIENEPVQAGTDAVPGQLAITGRLTDADLLNALNALRSTLEMLREHADLECTVNLPPVMKL